MKNDLVKSRKSAMSTPKTQDGHIGGHRSEPGVSIDFHGASVINERNEEVPITEHMVRNACKNYIQQWEAAQKKQPSD